MSVDPWSWGVEETPDQERNNCWSNAEFHHNQAKNAGGYGGGYPRSNNNAQSAGQQWQGAGWPPPQSATQPLAAPHPNPMVDYSSKVPPPPTINNNTFPEVENKEIAPPDHHPQAHGNRQPMKLANKHFLNDRSSHQGNAQQHVQQGVTAPRNQPHHSTSDSRKDFFQSDNTGTWSYFDQVSQHSVPPPPLTGSVQTHSLPPEQHTLAPNHFFNDHSALSPPQQEPQNINYFQMQDKTEYYQNFSSNEPPKQNEPVNNHMSPKQAPVQDNSQPNKLEDVPLENIDAPIEKEHFSDRNLTNFSANQFQGRPTSNVQSENMPIDLSHQGGEVAQSGYNDQRTERFDPQGFEEIGDPVGVTPANQEWNKNPPSLQQQSHYESDRPEVGSNRFSTSHSQSERRTGPQEYSNTTYHPDRPGSHSSAERTSNKSGPTSHPQSQDKPPSKDSHHMPPPPIQSNQDWRGHHHKSQGDRPSSQGREWTGPFLSGTQERLGHQRTGSLGSDRSGSLGRDRSSSEKSGSSRNNSVQDPPPPRADFPGSHNEPSGLRNDPPRRDSGPHSEASVTRPDRVPSRSPGAGEDRSPPSSRPDNLESLPPESNIAHQMNQLSLHSKDQLGDCPLDRNEYLETSQLSNQETKEMDLRTRQGPTDMNSKTHRGERREVVGEAEPLTGRVVVGHTTPTTTPPPHNHHSDEVEGGGNGSMERMIPGERREQDSRSKNSGSRWRRNQHRRESSYEEDDQDYSSDNKRTHRDDYRREDRHRNERGGQDHRSSDYMSDEEYEIDRRTYSRRDRRVRDRDRDRDRERDYDRDYRRDYYRDDVSRRSGRRGREYYRYEDDEYMYRERSRPSSRSESDYRRANHDYQQRNQSRHYFNPSLAGVLGGREYEANPEYFEMLRKSNPVLYAIWYQDYMRKLQDTATHSAFTQSDRASIHSGQSSGNRLHASTPSQVLDSNIATTDSFDDYSPRLFSTPHVRGSYDSQGRLVLVNACNPLDGQSASVHILSVDPVDEDPMVQEFLDSPGPFIPGVTHRSSVLQYLRKMSDQSGKSSEKLLYDLVHLIVKSNGKPDAGDISELLLESYRLSKGDSRDDWDPEESAAPMCHQIMLATFRNLLHQGNKLEALEWAMKHGGWGHALFLSSKMDARTQARVSAEFARSLAPSDPLSTLYQMISGGVPAAATACSDRRWADWRPHLAMVLSNLTDKPSADLATITTLADGLASRGRLHAAHSCYIIAQVMFGQLYRGEGPVLLGCSDPQLDNISNHVRHPSDHVFNYRSFLLTLCYEYAVKQGNPSFFIPTLQRYKLLVAWRLVEWGRGRQALLYCELLASEVLTPGTQLALQSDLIHLLLELSSSLKSLDPACAHSSGDLSTSPDPDWLSQLKQIAATLPQEEIEPMPASVPEQSPYSNFEGMPHVPMYRGNGNVDVGFQNQVRLDEAPVLSISESMDQPSSTSTPSKPNEVQQLTQQMQQGIPTMQQGMPAMQPGIPTMQPGVPTMQPTSLPPVSVLPPYSQSAFSSQPPSYAGYGESGSTEVDHAGETGVLKQPSWETESNEPSTASLSSNRGTSFYHASENILQGVGDAGKTGLQKPSSAPAAVSKTEPQKKTETSNGSSSGSWFGGFLGKLSMKPKNQMILPDDKDPKIVFDAKQQKWVDRDNEGKEGSKELKPPPMGGPGSIGMPLPNQSAPTGNPGIPLSNPPVSGPPSTNKYKLQKGKSMKSNYVDILSNSRSNSKVPGSMEPLLPMQPQNDKVNPNYFVPQPADGSQMQNDNSYQGQMTSQTVPTFYNPANFKS